MNTEIIQSAAIHSRKQGFAHMLSSILCLCIVLFTGCDSSSMESADDIAVIEAFLFAGEPIDDILVTSTLPFNSTDTVAAPINDAVISLIKDGISYSLTSSSNEGTYHYEGDDLSVEPGDRFTFVMEYLGQTITAETDVPPAPLSVELDTTIFDVPSFNFGGGGGGPPRGGGPGGLDNRLLVTWDNSADLLHYVVISSVQENPESIFPDFIGQRLGRRFRFISEPTRDNFFEVNLLLLEGIGEHQIKVYRVNQEYADLYDNRTQDSRDLNQPPDNIIGALGVFSAFNSVDRFFDVKRVE
ncbi:MAG: DUF4249 domain-containing protein [Rhodothermaceae bacterium]|nr:DUF4249 domain-containing protein [Rhodothermaceae bacterium]